MKAKILILLVIASTSCAAQLRRTPKVYNALITTDENLTSSRAFPVIQPTLHETGIAHYPFGPYGPYEYYNQPLVRFGQPIAPGLGPREQLELSFPLSQHGFPPQVLRQHEQPQPYPGYPSVQNPPATSSEQQNPEENAEPSEQNPQEQEPVKPPPPTQQEQNPPRYMPMQQQNPHQMPKERLPIPLNAYGLPPALIPFQQYPNNQRSPEQIPPYGYNQYPLVYDPITGYREQFLPPYDYFPSHGYVFGSSPPIQQQQPQHPQQPQYPQQQQQPQQSQQQQQPQKPQPPQQPHQPYQPQTSSTTVTQPSPSTYDTPSPYTDDTTMNETSDVTAQTPPMTTDYEAIKNVSKNKNRAVPDVPPPPIPSGARTKQGS